MPDENRQHDCPLRRTIGRWGAADEKTRRERNRATRRERQREKVEHTYISIVLLDALPNPQMPPPASHLAASVRLSQAHTPPPLLLPIIHHPHRGKNPTTAMSTGRHDANNSFHPRLAAATAPCARETARQSARAAAVFQGGLQTRGCSASQ